MCVGPPSLAPPALWGQLSCAGGAGEHAGATHCPSAGQNASQGGEESLGCLGGVWALWRLRGCRN